MNRIKNAEQVARTKGRKDALSIVDAAFRAIDTEEAIRAACRVEGTHLDINGTEIDLASYERVFIIGFGKASCAATIAIQELLHDHLTGGIVIDVRGGVCEMVEVYEGTHPYPSQQNVTITQKIVDLAHSLTERDLVIVVVSGGGSALLCFPYTECDEGARLFEEMQRAGATITEMNTVRKHISHIKGGGLARMLFPARVVGLVFCDVPGGGFEQVASGPTYKDETTVADAQAVLDRYGLTGYSLHETPKDARYFERVTNIPIVSNVHALSVMGKRAEEMGYRALLLGAAVYSDAEALIDTMLKGRANLTLSLVGGEPRVPVKQSHGSGGRCTFTALASLQHLQPGDVFVAFGSDGIDNSPAAGAMVDVSTLSSASAQGLDPRRYLESLDSYSFFEATGDLIVTGPTDANVSDLFLLLSQNV